MAYQPLQISSNTPTKVEGFIRRHVDMLFHDVHCMMRLPIPAQDLGAGCNFAAATFLLDVISGISTALYSTAGGSGAHFKGVLKEYYRGKWNRPAALTPRADRLRCTTSSAIRWFTRSVLAKTESQSQNRVCLKISLKRWNGPSRAQKLARQMQR
jgi:hypothetical protein